MISLVWFIIGTIIGGNVSLILYALFLISSREEVKSVNMISPPFPHNRELTNLEYFWESSYLNGDNYLIRLRKEAYQKSIDDMAKSHGNFINWLLSSYKAED